MRWIYRTSGLSLIEVLIAVTIMAFMGGAIYVTFAQGLRVWQRVQVNRPEHDIELVFERMTADLRNMWLSKTGNFRGDGQSFSFFSTSPDVDEDLRGFYTMGQNPRYITYTFDAALKSIERQNRGFLEAIAQEDNLIAGRVLADHISRFQVEYYYYDRRHERDVWQHSWNESCVPDAIKVSMMFGARDEEKSIFRFLPIPVGNCAVG